MGKYFEAVVRFVVAGVGFGGDVGGEDLPFLEELVVVDEFSEVTSNVFGALEEQYLAFRKCEIVA